MASNQITLDILKDKAAIINDMLGISNDAFIVDKYNPHRFHIDSAYNGWALFYHNNIFGGYRPKRELLELISAFINGLRFRANFDQRKKEDEERAGK